MSPVERKIKRLPILVVCRGRITNENGKVLYLRRSSASKVGEGAWELPGGKLDELEELEQSLYREIMEETGITSNLLEINDSDTKSHLVSDNGKYHGFLAIEITYELTLSSTPAITLSSEHSEYKWE